MAGKGTGRHEAITVCKIAGGTSRGIHRRSGPHTSTASASVAAHYGEAIDLQYTGHLKLGRLHHARSAYWSPNKSITASPFGIYRRVQRPTSPLLIIRQQHQRPQRRAAQMRAVANVRTIVFMLGVKTEWHRHPSRMPTLHAMPNFSPRSVTRD